MEMRRATSRMLLAIALLATGASQGCGEAHKPARAKPPPGKIEALREAQERAQGRIEAEGRVSAQEAERQHEAALAEAERELQDRRAHAR